VLPFSLTATPVFSSLTLLVFTLRVDGLVTMVLPEVVDFFSA
jgi:hypothetical protein